VVVPRFSSQAPTDRRVLLQSPLSDITETGYFDFYSQPI
jgi:hypothetical protein